MISSRRERAAYSNTLRTLYNIAGTGRVALVLAVTLVLIGCPDSVGDDTDTDTDTNNTDSPPPAAVSNLTATAIVDTADIELQWMGSVSDNAAMVRISWTPITDESPILIPHQSGMQNLTITGLTSEIEYAFSVVVIGNADTQSDAATVNQDTLLDITAPAAVSDVTTTALANGTEILLTWIDSISNDVATITIRWSSVSESVRGGSITARIQGESITVSDLIAATPYTFIITVADADGNATDTPPIQVYTPNPIDADADTLIDINSLERLNSVRYNLDGTIYKTSNNDSGILCGNDAAVACTGYELTRDLDFATAVSYDSGTVNAAWRPTGGDPVTATNAGWDPIGDCNTDTNDVDTDACDDDDDNNDTPFSTRFVGNSFTISNLYARNTAAAINAATGLFGIIDSTAAIHNIGIVDAALYGSSAVQDYVGGLVGYSNGTITASYASNSTTDGNDGMQDSVGGLVGISHGSIIASYASNSTAHGGMGNSDNAGGLVGINYGNIIASYASNSTAHGGMGNSDNAGGLVGNSSNSGTITASYASNSTAHGGMGNNDSAGGLVGMHSGSIIASYASSSIVNGGIGTADSVGGLVGMDNAGTITASHASGTVNGDADNDDSVGGLVGTASSSGITSTYSIATTDGGGGDNDSVGSLTGSQDFPFSGGIFASYGFGAISGQENTGASDSGDRPSMVGGSGTGIAGARQLTAPATDATTAVASQWNDGDQNTQDAWHFGTAAEAPALQYADYDGDGTDYGCGNTTGTIATIPNMIPTPTGYVAVTCGSTLLLEQER